MKIKWFICLLVLASIFLGGCGGMVLDAVHKSKATDGTYAEIVSDFPKMDSDAGRLFVYRTTESTKSSLAYGIGLYKNAMLCTVDGFAFDIIWESFRYFDVREGVDELSCGQDVLKEAAGFSKNAVYQQGKNKVILTIESGVEYYVRVDATKSPPFSLPVLMESEVAKSEISSLPFQKANYFTAGGTVE